MNSIIASGPAIIENGKLLVIKDSKDDFYKLPGGKVKENDKVWKKLALERYWRK